MTEKLTAIPLEALDSHLAILGIQGAGKTYAAKGAVERLLSKQRRVCVIDPTGVWWGLRLARDGKHKGFDVVIFGGDRADVPLDGTMGGPLAQLVAEGEFSCVIDVLRMTVGARTRFFAEFAEGLARANRRPLHLVIDEAHLFAPQGGAVQDPMNARMVGAANHLVSGGRALGLRVMLISQRPAKVHKDSLTQAQSLVAMRMVAPQDRKAVKDWIGEWVERELGDDILSGLPAMPTGQGWVWVPLLGVLERAHFARIDTFDSSATPDADAERPAPQLKALPIEELRAALTGEEPAETEAARAARKPKPSELATAEQRGYQRGFADGERRGIGGGIAIGLERARAALAAVDGRPPDPIGDAPAAPALAQPLRPSRPRREPSPAPAAGDPADLGSSAKKLLEVLRATNIPDFARDWPTLATLAGLAPRGGSFNVACKQLIAGGHVHSPGGLLYAAAPAQDPKRLDAAEITQAWCDKLGGSARRILSNLYVREATKEDLAKDLDIAPRGGSWNVAWKALRDNGLVDEGSNGTWLLAQALRALKAGRT